MSNKIKPCPLCDGSSVLVDENDDFYSVTCINCGLSTGLGRSPEELINLWNSRPQEERLIKAFEEVVNVFQDEMLWGYQEQAIERGRQTLITARKKS